MTTLIVQCPNALCGWTSHLGVDPLGRIFRCPRCLTKLPSSSAAAADTRWTAVLGATRPALDSPFTLKPSRRSGGGSTATLELSARSSAGFESGEMLIDACDFNSENDESSYMGLGPDDSSEVVLGPFHSGSRSVSRSSAAVKSSYSAAVSARSSVAAVNASQALATLDVLGRFRIIEMLGEGQHATVFRAYDPLLERDVALKVPRQGVIKTTKGLERFLGEAKALARLRHPQIVPVYEAGCVGDRHYHGNGAH